MYEAFYSDKTGTSFWNHDCEILQISDARIMTETSNYRITTGEQICTENEVSSLSSSSTEEESLVAESLDHFVQCVMCGLVRDAKKTPKKDQEASGTGTGKQQKWVLIHSGPFSVLQHNRATLNLHPEVTKHPTELQESIPWRNQQPGRPSELPAGSGRFSMTNTHHPLPYYLSLYFSVPPTPTPHFPFSPAVCLPLRSYYVYDS